MRRPLRSRAVLSAIACLSLVLAPSMAQAQYFIEAGHHGGHGWRGGYEAPPDRYRGYDGRYEDRGLGDRGRRYGRRHRCRDRGDGGTIIGAIAGGLLGNAVAGRGDRTMGTLLGAGGGALAGRAIDRDC